ncbi:transcriptional regulator, AsnC family protein (plasmid) [Rhizobium grahamii CCGE 502]|uniref:Transcriptional regulator, AsnC family protein n=1 Tax=Rhizobium grahamii CCGE 502 TaxID=990285 RepID=S3H6I7_9HYPH|nr:transcriptional regulator, AsnC family protein [Rhizobium grahamii CCGE 502]
MTLFVSIQTASHSVERLKRLSEAVAEFNEVIEVYRISGDVDYLMRVVVSDIPACMPSIDG